MRKDVVLFADLPGEGWKSMDNYARGLMRGFAGSGTTLNISLYVPTDPTRHLDTTFGRRARYIWRYLAYPILASRQQARVNHVLDHSYGHLVRFLEPSRTVVTVHDIAPLAQRPSAGQRRLSMVAWDWALRGALRATRLIAISEFTKRELVRLTGVRGDDVRVVHYGVDETFYPASSDESPSSHFQSLLPGPGRVVLHVGTCDARKNIDTLLESYAIIRAQYEGTVWLLKVGGEFTPSHRRLMERLQVVSGVVHLPSVSHAHIVRYYQQADLLLFPSTYEGFGFPVLEAMACGLPVVCSTAASLPEVAAHAALMCDPQDPAAFAAGALRFLRDEDLRAEFRERGIRRASRFTWTETARSTLEVYSEVLELGHKAA